MEEGEPKEGRERTGRTREKKEGTRLDLAERVDVLLSAEENKLPGGRWRARCCCTKIGDSR